jgi:hypothetical protein
LKLLLKNKLSIVPQKVISNRSREGHCTCLCKHPRSLIVVGPPQRNKCHVIVAVLHPQPGDIALGQPHQPQPPRQPGREWHTRVLLLTGDGDDSSRLSSSQAAQGAFVGGRCSTTPFGHSAVSTSMAPPLTILFRRHPCLPPHRRRPPWGPRAGGLDLRQGPFPALQRSMSLRGNWTMPRSHWWGHTTGGNPSSGPGCSLSSLLGHHGHGVGLSLPRRSFCVQVPRPSRG